MSEPLWTPEKTRAAQTTLAPSQAGCHRERASRLPSYDELHRYSTAVSGEFWSALWDFASVLGDKGNPPYLVDAGKMPGARFFSQAPPQFR